MLIKRTIGNNKIEVELNKEELKEATELYLRNSLQKYIEDVGSYRLRKLGVTSSCFDFEKEYSKIVDVVVNKCKVEGFYKGLLRQQIDAGFFIATGDITKDWRIGILADAGVYLTEINKNFDVVFNDVFSMLSGRTQHILEGVYKNGLTLQKVGEEVSLSRERVRQIREKAFRHIRNYDFQAHLDYAERVGCALVKKERKYSEKSFTVDELATSQNLSVRSYNVLLRYVGQSTEKAVRLFFSPDWKSVKNCGSKTVEEIRRALCLYYCRDFYEELRVEPECYLYND